MHRNLCIVAVLSLGLAGGPVAGEVAEFPLEEVRRGVRGTGYSVFSGDQPEPFDVELLGVWQEVAPQTSFVLAKLSGQGLEQSGVVAGMSGSPVYVDGRLLGAVAFSWSFAQEAIAGITPIEVMRRLDEQPAGAPRSVGRRRFEVSDLFAPELAADDLWGRLRAVLEPERGGGLLWSLSGVPAATRQWLGATVSNGLASGGRTDTGDGVLEAGDAVAAVLMDGDLRMAATGTVTARTGDTVLAFGHPFLGVGELSVPMAEAEVITVVSNRAQSFKLANTGAVVGAFELDRAPGIRGRVGAVASMIPLTVAVNGDRQATYELRMADVPELVPSLLAIALLGGVDATTQNAGASTLDLSLELDFEEVAPVRLMQSFDGQGAPVQAAIYSLALTSLLLDNGWRDLALRAARINVRQGERRSARLLAAHPDRRIVSPGERVEIRAQLAPLGGDPVYRSLSVDVPEDLNAGLYYVLVGDGTSVDAARLAVEKSAPTSASQLLDLVRSLSSRRRLAATGLVAERGLRVAGRPLPRLPGSVRSIWSAADAESSEGLELALTGVVFEEMEWPVSGLTRVDLEVVPHSGGGGME